MVYADAMQVARSESERLITSVGKEIGDMSDCGRIPAGETRPIIQTKAQKNKSLDRSTK